MKKILFIILLSLGFAFNANAQLPATELKNLEGKTINTSNLSDGKNPVIISFFATWCKPCLRELAAIHEVYEDWQEETGVRFVAVSIDEGANSFKVKPLIRAKAWNYEVLLDVNSEFKRAMDVNLIPCVFILDKKGKIVYRHTGYVEGGETEILEELRKLK